MGEGQVEQICGLYTDLGGPGPTRTKKKRACALFRQCSIGHTFMRGRTASLRGRWGTRWARRARL